MRRYDRRAPEPARAGGGTAPLTYVSQSKLEAARACRKGLSNRLSHAVARELPILDRMLESGGRRAQRRRRHALCWLVPSEPTERAEPAATPRVNDSSEAA